MNREQRRSAAKLPLSSPDRADAIRLAYRALASSAPTATGATLILSDGRTLYLGANDARALYAQSAPAEGSQ